MPNDSLRPPKKSSSTSYVIAAVVMVALAGGLILWKLSGDSRPQKTFSTAAAAVTTTESPSLETAPPPPPPATTSAAPSATAPTSARVATGKGSGTGCAVNECKGTAGADLRSALQAKAGQARSCYQNALRNNPTLQGKMSVSIRIGQGGQVCSAAVANDQLGDPMVTNCVSNLFRAGSFPSPKGGCIDASVPMNFIPKS